MAFEDSKKKVETLDALVEMRNALQKLGPVPSGMEIYNYAIHFFNIIAQFNDKYSVQAKMFATDKENVQALAEHLKKAGRDQYGWVRSKKGESVTIDNLYLGNVYGIWTNTARTFMDMPNDKYVQDAIQGQLRSFIRSHREPMLEGINHILKTEKKPNGIFFRMFGGNSIKK